MAFAASPKKAGGKAAKLTTLHCNLSLATQPPSGSNSVPQPSSQGTMYGPVHCGTKGFGGGIEAAPFTVPASGDTVGTYTKYLKAGTISGSYNWSPDEGAPISTTTFTSQTWTGTFTVTGGTGVYKGIKGKNSTGVVNCSSSDNVHFSCTETIKVKLPTTTTGTATS
jgi:hypothetical protein